MFVTDPRKWRLSFPHLGDYRVFFHGLVKMTGCEIIEPPPITKRTLELGSRYSPDSVCVPFKYNLGNYLEAIELGANAFCTTAGGCRFEYYFEVHKKILEDLGHNVDFLRLSKQGLYRELHAVNPRLTRLDFLNFFWLETKKLHLFDGLGDVVRKRLGFETVRGSFEGFWRRFLKQLPEVKAHGQLRRFARDATSELLSIPIDRPANPLRVGIIGELYTVMEPFCNFRLEEKLARMGVEVHRWVTVSSIIEHDITGAMVPRHLLKMAYPYVRYHIGAHGTESVARLSSMIKQGFDGAIHLKPLACMPEISAMPAMHKMCRDHRFPLTTLSFDSETAEAGVVTRLEAFFDMISQKRAGGAFCSSAT